jgi:hypothetical protein
MGYAFGFHAGHLKARANAIAFKHGARHINYTDPVRQGLFECEDRGEEHNRAVENAVLADVEAAGGFEGLRRRRRDGT